MIQSSVMPVLVKIQNLKRQYKRRGLTADQNYHVICYDVKHLIVTNGKIDKAYKVEWEDVELVKSEWSNAPADSNNASLAETRLLRQAMSKLGSNISRLRKTPR